MVYIAVGTPLLHIVELHSQVVLELSLLVEEVGLVPIGEVPFIGGEWLALEGLEPVGEPVARHGHGFRLEDSAAPQEEQFLDEVLLVADVPAPGADCEQSLNKHGGSPSTGTRR